MNEYTSEEAIEALKRMAAEMRNHGFSLASDILQHDEWAEQLDKIVAALAAGEESE